MTIRTFLVCAFLVMGWPQAESQKGPPTIKYVGSSTIGEFILDAQAKYRGARFLLDTAPESAGGQQAARRGTADIGGVAGEVAPEILNEGVVATLIGKDAIAVIVHPSNPVADLSRDQLKGIFTGQITNWQAVGGRDRPIQPLIVGPTSATRHIFRATVLPHDAYEGCEAVTPDEAIIDRVAHAEGAIGQISFAFLMGRQEVKPIAVEGQEPTVRNFDYPITRPLYLCTNGPPKGAVEKFIKWALGAEGQKVLMQRFVGRAQNVLGSVGPRPRQPAAEAPAGFLVVDTPTYSYEDSDVYYYPHRPYDIYDLAGKRVQHVRNHQNEYDERPTMVRLPPGKYHLVAETGDRRRFEVQVTIESGQTTEVDVRALLKRALKPR